MAARRFAAKVWDITWKVSHSGGPSEVGTQKNKKWPSSHVLHEIMVQKMLDWGTMGGVTHVLNSILSQA
jgi:hypothetical protein